MAVLHHLLTDRYTSLGARTIIGRSRACTVRLTARRASGEHAAMVWGGDGWRLRDLGSSNGTWLGDQRLVAGAETPVQEGARLAFGDTDDPWVLIDTRAPDPFARSEADGAVVDAIGGVIGLPSSDDPQLTIFRGAAGWSAEDATGCRRVNDQDLVAAGGTAWRLFLPVVIDTTLMEDGPRAPTLGGLRLGLRVSRDQEFVTVTLSDGETVTEVPPRTMHYMLVVLAQARRAAASARPESPPGDGDLGWVAIEEVARALQVEHRTVDVYICRLRQQLGDLGIAGAAEIIERRPGAGQLRLGQIAVDLHRG